MSTSGAFLSCTVNGSNFAPLRVSWRARPTGNKLDAATARDNGYTNTDHGLTGVEIEVSYLIDPALGSPPAVVEGTQLTNFIVKGHVGQTTATDYELPTAIVVEAPREVEVAGQIKGSFKVENKGIFYRDGVAARTGV